MKRRLYIPLLLICCVIAAGFINRAHAVDFVITVETDKATYVMGEVVYITGNLTLNNESVPDALIGLQVNDPVNPYVFRTLYTGETPPELIGDLTGDGAVDIFDIVIVAKAFSSVLGDQNWDQRADVNGDNKVDIFDMVVLAIHYGEVWGGKRDVRVTDVFIADQMGNRVTSATKGISYWIWVNFTGRDASVPLNTTIGVTVYDSTDVPRYALASRVEVVPGGNYYVLFEWRVPDEAELGAAKVYASAYSNLPQNQGRPYCLEKFGAFNIVSSLSLSLTTEAIITPMQAPTNYSSSFRLPATAALLGNYTVYASSFYIYNLVALIAFDSASFEVTP